MLHNAFYSLLYDIIQHTGARVMRIAAVSDIHARAKGEDADLLEAIRKRVSEHNPDVFIIAGDMSESLDNLGVSLSAIRVDNCSNLYVAGNHDIWFEDKEGYGSLEKYSHFIQEVCEDNGFIHLPNTPFFFDKIAVIGSIGWYDYSFKRESLDIPIENYEMKQFHGAYWRDLYCIDWTLTDYEATDFLNRKLEYDLRTLPDDIQTVIYVSHHLPFKELTLYKDRLPWDFFSAFMGAVSTGEILLNDKRVKLSISGHSHIRTALKKESLLAITAPLGYGRPKPEELDDFVESAIAILEIENAHPDIVHFVEGDICEDMEYSF
jgi:putative phosphoesterase